MCMSEGQRFMINGLWKSSIVFFWISIATTAAGYHDHSLLQPLMARRPPPDPNTADDSFESQVVVEAIQYPVPLAFGANFQS